MILEAIFNAVALVILGIINIFPTIPTVELSFLDNLFQALSLIDMFVSLKVFSVCMVTIFIFMNINLVWSVIMWVVRKIPSVE